MMDLINFWRKPQKEQAKADDSDNFETREEAIARFDVENEYNGRKVVRFGVSQYPITIVNSGESNKYILKLDYETEIPFETVDNDIKVAADILASGFPEFTQMFVEGSLWADHIEGRHKTRPEVFHPKSYFYITGVRKDWKTPEE